MRVEVIAYDADNVGPGKVTGGKGDIGAGAAKHAVDFPVGRFDAVVGHRGLVSRAPQVAAVHLNCLSIVLAGLDPQWQMADTAGEKIAVPLRAFAKDTAATNRRENSKSKTPQVYAGEIHS